MLIPKVYAQGVNIRDNYKFGNDKIPFDSLGSFFNHILNPVYVIAGIIMMFLLIFGGISVIIGAGQQDSSQMQKGQKAITAAVLGFVVIVGSYFIIQLIQVVTGVDILNPNI